MKRYAITRPMLPALAVLLTSCNTQSETFARASQITQLDQTIGGPKALGQVGDFLLENDRVRGIIVGDRASMGPGVFGGGLVDVDLQRSSADRLGGFGNDLFAELGPTVNLNIMEPIGEEAFTLIEGDDGSATVRISAKATPYFTLLKPLWAIVSAPDLWMVTEYTLRPDESWFRIKTTVHYTGGNEPTSDASDPAGYLNQPFPLIDWAVQSGVTMGDFYLQGGSIDAFAPGVGFDEDGLVFEARQQHQNTFTQPFMFDFVAGTGDGVSYGIAPIEGKAFVPLFTAGQTAVFGGARDGDGSAARFTPGSALSYERYFFVGHGDVGSIVDSYVEALNIPYGEVVGRVIEEATGLPMTDIHVFAYKTGESKPWSEWRTDVRSNDQIKDGSFSGRLPVGDWELLVHQSGRPDSERVPITVTEGGQVGVSLESPRPGLFTFSIYDDEGRLMPGKVSLFAAEQPTARDPILGDGFIAGDPEMVLFSLDGTGQAELPNGTYYAIASRGLEYELSESAVFTIDPSNRHHMDFMLEHTVQTEGWVSADLHVHAIPSHDSGILLADRVRTMAAEGVEFFASTDHDYVTDYAPTIEALGVERWVHAATGVETTTLELGHFLAFPMQQNYLGTAGGAMDWTGMTPREIMGRLKTDGEDAGFDPAVFVGHPRDGILGYFDQYGFNPYGGQPGSGGETGIPLVTPGILSNSSPLLGKDNIDWNFDGLEILGGKRVDLLRTPTAAELAEFGRDPNGPTGAYQFMQRTLTEQAALTEGTLTLGYGPHGGIDDWFTLLNLGFRFTILGNSDTHGWTSTEAGCPRNYIMSDTDEPQFLDDQAMADAVKAHRVVASYGPFMTIEIDGHPIGDTFQPEGETATLTVDVQAPTWMDVDRVELYENGVLIHAWDLSMDPRPADASRHFATIDLTPKTDAWYVAIAMGEDGLDPVFTRVEIPYVNLQEIVSESLSGIPSVGSFISPAIPVPRKYPIFPFAITNPIWLDLDGDGFDAAGPPAWMKQPVDPTAE